MKELVGSVVFVFVLTLNANAQIPQTTRNSEVKALVEKGLALYQAENFSAAADAFRNAVAIGVRDLKTEEPVLSTRLFDQIYSSKVVRLLR